MSESRTGPSPVSVRTEGAVTVVQLDDGKVNVLGPALMDDLFAALDVAERDAGAVVLAGRPGVFCAGFDLRVIGAMDRASAEMFAQGADLFLRLAEFPRPVVAACTGHAVAAGAVLLLCCDVRIGDAGDFKIGLNEVGIGLPIPELVLELARRRLSPRHLTRAALTAQIYTPSDAAEVGFLDRTTTGDAVSEALTVATDLADRLDAWAFAATRRVTAKGLAEILDLWPSPARAKPTPPQTP